LEVVDEERRRKTEKGHPEKGKRGQKKRKEKTKPQHLFFCNREMGPVVEKKREKGEHRGEATNKRKRKGKKRKKESLEKMSLLHRLACHPRKRGQKKKKEKIS